MFKKVAPENGVKQHLDQVGKLKNWNQLQEYRQESRARDRNSILRSAESAINARECGLALISWWRQHLSAEYLKAVMMDVEYQAQRDKNIGIYYYQK